MSFDTETVPEELFESDAFVTDASFLEFIKRMERDDGADISPNVRETIYPETDPVRLTEQEAVALIEEWKTKER